MPEMAQKKKRNQLSGIRLLGRFLFVCKKVRNMGETEVLELGDK